MNFQKARQLQRRSHDVIPGGAHTYAKGDDQFPEEAPGFIARGAGSHVWDIDGNEFIEYGMGLRSVTLGHAYRPVIEAAYREMQKGINFTRPSPIELECAERVMGVVPSAQMVKFAKNGSDVTTAAVKLARAYTNRDLVVVCADHPFFSCDDWFIGTTEMAAGIPRTIRDLVKRFHYNDIASLMDVFKRYPDQVACLIMEAERTEPPGNGFLEGVVDLCHRHGAVFILDEIITGFRWHIGGAQAVYTIEPDLSAFGKAMGNGFSIAALTGKKEIMRAGGIDHDRERVFLLSTTFGAETHCLAAALETMRIYEREPVIDHLRFQGERLRRGMTELVDSYRLNGYVGPEGHPANLTYYTCDERGQRSQQYRTLFLQELIRRGVIAPSLVVSYSHSDDDVQRTLDALDGTLRVYARALEDGIGKYLVGRPVKPVMRKYC